MSVGRAKEAVQKFLFDKNLWRGIVFGSRVLLAVKHIETDLPFA
jgi:hypothetical protein